MRIRLRREYSIRENTHTLALFGRNDFVCFASPHTHAIPYSASKGNDREATKGAKAQTHNAFVEDSRVAIMFPPQCHALTTHGAATCSHRATSPSTPARSCRPCSCRGYPALAPTVHRWSAVARSGGSSLASRWASLTSPGMSDRALYIASKN